MRKRAAVFRRGAYLCESCQGAIAVEVHHVNGDPGDNRLENLLGVCSSCHRQLEAKKRHG